MNKVQREGLMKRMSQLESRCKKDPGDIYDFQNELAELAKTTRQILEHLEVKE
jgi:hypothetical protein